MLFRVSGRGRAAPAARRRMAVTRLGEAADAPRRRKPFLLRLISRFQLRSLLLRSRRALARVRECYADVMRGLIAEAAAVESAKARRKIEAAPARQVVVPPVVARAVLRCNSHYYIR